MKLKLLRLLSAAAFIAAVAVSPTVSSTKAMSACTGAFSGYPCDCQYDQDNLEDVRCDFFPDPADEGAFCDVLSAGCDWGITSCFCGTYVCHGTCFLPN